MVAVGSSNIVLLSVVSIVAIKDLAVRSAVHL